MATDWEWQRSDELAASGTDGETSGIPRDGRGAARLISRTSGVKREDDAPTASTASEDEDVQLTDGEEVYKNFKERKSLARKRTSLQARKSRERTRLTRKRKSVGVDSIVGKREASPRDGKKPKWYKQYGQDGLSDDNMLDDTLPEYLQKRRQKVPDVDGKKPEELQTWQSLVDLGIKLPPLYDDVDFSDEEDDRPLAEKPAFANVPTSRKYEDISLPLSLGIIPAPIAQWLRDYQVEGVSFLHEKFIYHKGCILGDDMGLGKTVQVIAFLTAAYGKTGDVRDAKRMRKLRRLGEDVWYPRTLIICPGTLIRNWCSEFERWGWWHVDLFHGPGKEAALEAAMAGRTEVLITTYKTYTLNKDMLNMVEWDCVIADECHLFKERTSETAKAINEVNSLCRIGLTGTAIQNKYEELWTLLNWTNPGRFGPISDWRRLICQPLRIGQSHDATLNELRMARKIARQLVDNLLPQFFLRRMKTLIAHQLPKKLDRAVFCPLTPMQADAYENLLESDVIDHIVNSTEPCLCGSGKKQGWCCEKFVPEKGRWQNYVFPSMQSLQKLSNHLAMLIPQSADPREKQEKDIETLQTAVPDIWNELYKSRDSIIHYSNPEFCGKWKVLRKLLKWWHANGDKVLVFSHSVRLLRMLEMLFRHTSYNVSYLDGAMSYEERSRAVDEFNNDPRQFVFLISTRAGGVGLNITSANKVVVVDPNWNPSYDLQAQDRAYRIGQVRDVEVFRLISIGTIEEIVYARQIYKQQQANIAYNASEERRYFQGVQERKDKKGEIFGLRNLFQYKSNNIVLRDIVNKTNVAESKAGVSVAELEIEEDDVPGGHEDPAFTGGKKGESKDAAMNQMAEALMKGEDDDGKVDGMRKTAASANPIQAILAGAGVEYTHENSEVIGSSAVEKRLSRRAQASLPDYYEGDRQAFENEDTDGSVEEIDGDDYAGLRPKYEYHPPAEVMKRQFCSMARSYGFESTTEFALTVEGMTQAQRRAFLDKWYRERRQALGGRSAKAEPASSANVGPVSPAGTATEPVVIT